MTFKKGEIASPTGRGLGAVNKVTKELKAIITRDMRHLVCNLSALIEEIEDPKDKLDAIVKVLPYMMSKVNDNQLVDERDRIIIQYLPPQDAEVIK